MTIEDRARSRIATLLHLSADELEASTPLTALAADSLDLVEVAIALEEEFGVSLRHDELEAVHTVGDLVAAITRDRAGCPAQRHSA
jgi:acyl carrier protein